MIDITNLSFQYGKKEPVYKGINLNIKEKKIVGLLGHNGAGKTTLIKLIAGLLKPNEGSIIIKGLTPNVNKHKRGMLSYMPEYDGIYNQLTVMQNMKFRARLIRLEKSYMESECERVLKIVGLWKKRDSKAFHLSNGMRKRLVLACSCLDYPEVLLLDEPTNGVDQESKQRIIRLLKSMNDKGTTIIVSSHDFELINMICNDVVIINSGEIEYCGEKPDEETLKEKYSEITFDEEEDWDVE
jgi:ABC-2 type transport system ATP-binding protein